MRRLGDGDLNLPFEPSSGQLDMSDGALAGGVIVIAGHIHVPDVGPMPCLIFRFTNPDGTFMRPVTLVAEPDEIIGAGKLVTQAAAAAVQAAAR
jgi:hypothetical protein